MARRIKQINGYRSGFENKVASALLEQKIKFGYEVTQVQYIKPETHHKYTVDFTLPNGILIETKGRWTMEDRKKHILIKQQHPELDIRFVFQNATNKLNKSSSTTYAAWCDKHDFKWSQTEVPQRWLSNSKK